MSGIRLERTGGLVTARFDKARGNAIDEPFTQELLDVATQLGADPDVRGVTLVEYDRAAMERFMRLFAEAVWALYALRKPVVAAVGGHAVAGGCILALTADYRVLKRGGVQMGLNEVKVGVPLPWSVALLLRASVPSAALTQVALLGRNFADDDARAVGLADQLADADGFEDFCRARLEEFRDVIGFIERELPRVIDRFFSERAGTAGRKDIP